MGSIYLVIKSVFITDQDKNIQQRLMQKKRKETQKICYQGQDQNLFVTGIVLGNHTLQNWQSNAADIIHTALVVEMGFNGLPLGSRLLLWKWLLCFHLQEYETTLHAKNSSFSLFCSGAYQSIIFFQENVFHCEILLLVTEKVHSELQILKHVAKTNLSVYARSCEIHNWIFPVVLTFRWFHHEKERKNEY